MTSCLPSDTPDDRVRFQPVGPSGAFLELALNKQNGRSTTSIIEFGSF